MKSLKKDLRVVTKELKALVKKTEKVMKAADKLEKAKAAPKRKPKVKVRKKAARKKATALTATDQVLRIIKRTKKGIDAPTLMKKTGFADKKVRNILTRASKHGKIKRVARGTYVSDGRGGG